VQSDIYQVTKEPTSRHSSVGIATGYGLDDRGAGVRIPVESRIFSSPHRPDRLWGPLSLLSYGYRGLFPQGLKRSGREADNSPPANAEVNKNLDLYIHLPIILYGVVKNRDNFTFYL
jgi:hypothetical protein